MPFGVPRLVRWEAVGLALNLQDAEAKWQRNAQAGAANWHGDPAAYCRGLAKFGIPESTCMAGPGARYQQGTAAVSPQQFAARIAQVTGQRWGQRWIQGLQRA